MVSGLGPTDESEGGARPQIASQPGKQEHREVPDVSRDLIPLIVLSFISDTIEHTGTKTKIQHFQVSVRQVLSGKTRQDKV